MIRHIDIRVLPEEALNATVIRQKALAAAELSDEEVESVQVIRRSLDARPRPAVYQLRCVLYIQELPPPEPFISDEFQFVHEAKEVIIVGAGPAGYFAALECLSIGLKPILFDRGRDARYRRRDLKALQQDGIVHPDSNYCFGEGGAGTYSDGKLYTRSVKRGKMERVLRLFVEHGAKSDILIDAHPHIGSNKLPGVVMNIGQTIRHYGGEIHFSSRVTDLLIKDGHIEGVTLQDGTERLSKAVILATGHSARDIFHLLHHKGVALDFKPFALGVRIEHPQPLIDGIQYGKRRNEHLPPSSYSLACQVGSNGVFSFCMCPGGLIVPAATAPGELVVNGMSMSRRDSPFANAGTVVSVDWKDLVPYHKHGLFAGLAFQQEVEQSLFQAGDGTQRAPAQRLTDFISKKRSDSLPGTSYIPGIYSAPMHALLPDWISRLLDAGIQQFSKKMPGYLTREATIIGAESRTSSPVRIPRSEETWMHPEVEGLFPSGEGAGYAGGILSAAMDGQNCARAVLRFLEHK